MMEPIPDKRYFRIGEAASLVDVEAHVLRYWEKEFEQLRPRKSRSGQRLYRRADIELARRIKLLLHEQRFTIAGARQLLKRHADPESEDTVAEADLTLPVMEPTVLASTIPQPPDSVDSEVIDHVRKEIAAILALVDDEERS